MGLGAINKILAPKKGCLMAHLPLNGSSIDVKGGYNGIDYDVTYPLLNSSDRWALFDNSNNNKINLEYPGVFDFSDDNGDKPFSISLWAKHNTGSTTGWFIHNTIKVGGDENKQIGWFFYTYQDRLNLYLGEFYSGRTNYRIFYIQNVITNGLKHVAVSYDGNTVVFWVNGVMYDNVTQAGSSTYTGIGAINGIVRIAITKVFNQYRKLIGNMGDLMIFNCAIDDNTVQEIYNQQKGKYGL